MTQLSNVPMQPNPSAVERPLTLIEKLEQERNGKAKLADYYKTVALEHLVHGLDTAIGIVKQHSDWTRVDEYLKIAKANERVFIYDAVFEAVLPSRVRIIDGKARFQLTNGLYAMRVSHVCVMMFPQPPSEVQA